MALTDFVITDAGREMLTRAALEGDVIFTRGAVGRGALKPGSSLAARTTMNDRMADMRVAAPEISGDTVRIRCQFSNADGRGDADRLCQYVRRGGGRYDTRQRVRVRGGVRNRDSRC